MNGRAAARAIDALRRGWAVTVRATDGAIRVMAVEGADALIIATEWNEFRTPNFLKIVTALKNKVIFDGRNLFETNAIRELGFYYESIGREVAAPGK